MNVTGDKGKTIPFQKMHVLGNDFVIIDGRQETLCDISLFPDDIQKLCDRNRGIGCDQLLWVKEKPGGKPIVLVYNPDGSSAQACGNGTCCVAWLIMQKSDALECVIFVGDRLLKATRKTRQTCTLCIDMGAPQFFPDKEAEVRRIFGPDVYVVSMGNLHWVKIMNSKDVVESSFLHAQSQKAVASGLFPQGVNIECVNVLDPQHLQVTFFERNTGITQACGSGTCAAAAVCCENGLCESNLSVLLPGGTAEVFYKKSVFLTVEVSFVFQGEFSYHSLCFR